METAKKIASNTLAQVSAKFINAALSVVIIRIITGYLAEEGYGRYTLVYEFIAFFGIAADLGLFTIAVKEMAQYKEKLEKIVGNMISLRLVLVLIMGVLAGILVHFMPKYSTEIEIGVIIAAIGMGVNLLTITISSILQVHLKMTYNALALVLGKIFMVSYIYYVAQNDLGFVHLILAGLWNNIFVMILTTIFAYQLVTIKLKFNYKFSLDLFKKSFPYGMSLLFAAVYLHIGAILLKQFWGEEQVGIYGVALRVFELLILIPYTFMNSALPSIAKQINNKLRLNEIIQHSFDFLVTLSAAVMAGTMILAPYVIKFVSSGQFADSATVLKILVVAMFFYFLHSLFGYLLLATDQQRKLLWINMFAAIIALGTNFLLIPRQDILGSYNGTAISIVFPQIIVLFLTYHYAKKRLEFNLSFKNFSKILLSAFIMALVLFAIDYTNIIDHYAVKVILYIPLGALIYLISLIVSGGVSDQVYDLLDKSFPMIKKIQGNLTGKRIAMDVRSISGEKTGKEWYTLNLLKSLSKLDSNNTYFLYTKYDLPLNLNANFIIRKIKAPLILWHLFVIVDMKLNKVETLLATSSYIKPALCVIKKFKVVLVVHDTIAFLFPKKHQFKATTIEKYTLGQALKNAHKIISVSENTKTDLINLFKIDKDKIKVIGEAARENFKLINDKNQIKKVLTQNNLPFKYLLFVGTLEPRKNLVRLINAYSLLPAHLQNEYKLVIVGKKGWYYEEIFQAVKKRNLEEKIIFTGYVSDELLPYILNGATIFILPSLYEGFGLPLLEAFSCGTPVITSDNSSLKEVAGNACMTIDPEDEFQIVETIQKVLADKELRDQMIQKGLNRAKEFSWDNVAIQVKEIL